MPPIALETVAVSERSKVRFALSVTAPVPSVPEVPPLPICNVPEVIVVGPEYVLAPVSVVLTSVVNPKVPKPSEIAPDSVIGAVALAVPTVSVTGPATPEEIAPESVPPPEPPPTVVSPSNVTAPPTDPPKSMRIAPKPSLLPVPTTEMPFVNEALFCS